MKNTLVIPTALLSPKEANNNGKVFDNVSNVQGTTFLTDKVSTDGKKTYLHTESMGVINVTDMISNLRKI